MNRGSIKEEDNSCSQSILGIDAVWCVSGLSHGWERCTSYRNPSAYPSARQRQVMATSCCSSFMTLYSSAVSTSEAARFFISGRRGRVAEPTEELGYCTGRSDERF